MGGHRVFQELHQPLLAREARRLVSVSSPSRFRQSSSGRSVREACVVLHSRLSELRASRGVTAEEKTHLRGKLLELVREDSPQVAIQLALIVAKVARTDYPREWCVT